MPCITHHYACACREAAHADIVLKLTRTIAQLRQEIAINKTGVSRRKKEHRIDFTNFWYAVELSAAWNAGFESQCSLEEYSRELGVPITLAELIDSHRYLRAENGKRWQRAIEEKIAIEQAAIARFDADVRRQQLIWNQLRELTFDELGEILEQHRDASIEGYPCR